MKKFIIICLALCLILSLCGFTYVGKDVDNVKDKAHQIAELARSIGLPEDDPIIVRAQEIYDGVTEVRHAVPYTDAELKMLANVVHYESKGCPDWHQQVVARIVINRMLDKDFPNTIEGVITQPGAYLEWYARANPTDIEDRCYENARLALEGYVDIPLNVVYQAQFTQGSGIWKSSYVNTGWWESTTYFCYK